MKLEKIIIGLSMMFMLVLAGCGEGGEDAVDERVKTGTKGLQMEYIEDIPYDSEAYEFETFSVALNLENQGGYDIKEGWTAVSIDGPAEVTSSKVTPFANSGNILEGKGIFGIKGETKRVDIDFRAKEVALTKQQDSKIRTKACYKYETLLVESICIDPDVDQESVRKKPCDYQKNTGISGGQGSPVSITNIEFKRIPYSNNIKPVFRLKIANNENGKIIEESNTQGACSTGIEQRVFNKINAEATLNKQNLVCTQKDEDNQIYIECEGNQIRTTETPGFQELVIKLNYGYIIEKEKTIKILKKE